MLDRILRIIKLDFTVFKEIEADPKATTEAALVVMLASVLSGIGSAAGSDRPAITFIGAIVSGLVGWIVWSGVSYVVGKSLFQSKGTLDNLLRVIGYANAPRLLGILAVIPCVGWLGALAGTILALIAGIMAIREGLDLDVGQAIIVTVVGWIALLIVSIIVGVVLGIGAVGLRALFGAFSS